MQLLLEHGAEANLQDKRGRSPLHVAASRNRSETSPIITLLLEHGADAEMQDQRSKTPLELAQKEGNMSAAELLRKPGTGCMLFGLLLIAAMLVVVATVLPA